MSQEEQIERDLSGTTLSGRYELIARVGEGAMGSVYKARHTYMDKPVAVKLLHADLSTNAEFVERFQREAQAAAHIEHPNICAATDFGQVNNAEFFLVMEWLDGESLEELLDREGPLAPDRAVNIARQIADGLEKAHELGVVHRDLKPANIMLVTRDGSKDFVKVTDFGVAQVRINNSAKMTQAGAAYGTPSYMSPEQAKALEVDGRSDIYAVGIILYEMLTSRPPFMGDAIALVMAQHVTDAVPTFEEIAPNIMIPRWIRDLTMFCLEKEPEDRPQDARTLADMLDQKVDAQAPTAMAHVPDAIRASTKKPTPTNRLNPALPAFIRDRSLAFYIGVTLCLVLIMTIALGLLAGTFVSEQVGEISLENLSGERQEFSRQPEIAKALSLHASGKTKGAIKALNAAELNYESNPHFHFLRGTMQLNEKEYGSAFESFAKATELDPRYGRESGVESALKEATTSSSKERRATVTAFLAKHGNEDFRAALFEALATTSKSSERRRIASALKDSKELEKLEEWQKISVDLYSTTKCKPLKVAVDLAADSGDKQLEPALRYVHGLKKRGCGFLSRNDCYECMRKSVDLALTEVGVDLKAEKLEKEKKKKEKKD